MTPCNHARPFAHSPCFELGGPESQLGPAVEPCPNSMKGGTLVILVAHGERRYFIPLNVEGLWTFREVSE